MMIYDCRVRHAGNMLHEIPKNGVTAPEVMILRHIHGPDAVVSLQPRRNDRRPHLEEIDRLRREYGAKAFSSVFGDGYIEKLPQKLAGVEVTEEQEEAAEEEDAA